jgi:hypothetical protein
MGKYRKYKNAILEIIYFISLIFIYVLWVEQWIITDSSMYYFGKDIPQYILMMVGFIWILDFIVYNTVPLFKKFIIKLTEEN